MAIKVTRCLLISFFLINALVLQAQQRPQYTQYILNNYIVNPAISGIENYIDVKVGYRQQWSGIQNAPETNYFSIHAPIGKSDDRSSATSFSMVGDNPLGYNYKNEYTAAEPHHGIGLIAFIDKTGPISQSVVNVTYAYHLGISAQTNLSFGIGAGFNRISFNTTDVEVVDPGDPAINNGTFNKINPDLSAGLWFYSAQYFVGISAQQMLAPDPIVENNSNEKKISPHFFATAGYRFWLSDDITFMPSVMYNMQKPAEGVLNYSAKISFKDKIWLGAALRQEDAVSGLLGFNISSLFNVGYSYDFTTSQLNTVTKGSHEIVLGITLNNHYRVTCPQKFW